MLPALLSLCLLTQAASGPPSPPEAELWLVAGQSQMVGFNGGFGYRDESPGGPDRLPENVWMLDLDDVLVPARQPLASPLAEIALQGQHDNVSPAIRFLQRRAEASPNRTIAVVMVASNGSGFTQSLPDRNWGAPTSGFYAPDNLYDRLLSRADAAVAQLPLDAPTGLLWAQGESDSFLGIAGYAPEFALVINGLRAKYDPRLPVLVGGIPNSTEVFFPGVLQLDLFFQQISMSDPSIEYVRADGFDTVDFLHYDGPSCRVFGDRFATASFDLVDPARTRRVVFAGGQGQGWPGAAPSTGVVFSQRALGTEAATLFTSASAAAGAGAAPPGQFNALDEFESFRQSDGFFHLELAWFLASAEKVRVRWRQRSNPMTSPRDFVEGFAYRQDSPVTLPAKEFRGLCRTTIPGGLLTVRPGWSEWGTGPDLVRFRSKPSIDFDPMFATLGLTPVGGFYDRVRLSALTPAP